MLRFRGVAVGDTLVILVFGEEGIADAGYEHHGDEKRYEGFGSHGCWSGMDGAVDNWWLVFEATGFEAPLPYIFPYGFRSLQLFDNTLAKKLVLIIVVKVW